MPTQLSKVRRLILMWARGEKLDQIVRLREDLWAVPSASEPGMFHLTARLTSRTWICGMCKGFMYSEKDVCRHITNIKRLEGIK